MEGLFKVSPAYQKSAEVFLEFHGRAWYSSGPMVLGVRRQDSSKFRGRTFSEIQEPAYQKSAEVFLEFHGRAWYSSGPMVLGVRRQDSSKFRGRTFSEIQEPAYQSSTVDLIVGVPQTVLLSIFPRIIDSYSLPHALWVTRTLTWG